MSKPEQGPIGTTLSSGSSVDRMAVVREWFTFASSFWGKLSGWSGSLVWDRREDRKGCGPSRLTVPYSGGYSETTFQAAKPGRESGYQVWSGLENWEIYRWLVPGAQLASRLYQVEGKIPERFEPVEEFFFRNRVTPLLPVSNFQRADGVGKLQSRYLDSSGAWRQ